MRPFAFSGPRGTISGVDDGHGPPLVLLAGVGSTYRIWGGLTGLLARRFRVLALDNRGVGGSRGGDPFALDGAAADVVEALDRLQVKRSAVLGASMGAAIACMTALRVPRRVTRLALISGAARLSTHGRRVLALLRDLITRFPPEGVGPALMTLAFAPPFHERYPGLVREIAGLYGLDPADVPGARAQVEHLLGGWDLRVDLATLATPTLVLAGACDPIVAPTDTAELARCLANARLVEVPSAAHSVLAEGGAEVLEQVIEFLAAV